MYLRKIALVHKTKITYMIVTCILFQTVISKLPAICEEINKRGFYWIFTLFFYQIFSSHVELVAVQTNFLFFYNRCNNESQIINWGYDHWLYTLMFFKWQIEFGGFDHDSYPLYHALAVFRWPFLWFINKYFISWGDKVSVKKIDGQSKATLRFFAFILLIRVNN